MNGSDADPHRARHWTSRPPARFLMCMGVPYLIVIAMFAGLQRKLIYVPRKGDVPLAAAGIPVERITQVLIKSYDGVLLHGWLALAGPDPFPEERPLVILFPGNAGDRSYRSTIIQQLNALGCDVLACDYRGYAENAGEPTEEALAADAIAVWEYARSTLNVPPDRIIIYGQSLGGGVATRLVWDLKQADVSPSGLILKATFTSLVDAGRYNYPWLPVRLVLVDRYPSIRRIPEVTCPLLVIHGRRDRVVPFKQGQRLFDAAPPRSACGLEKEFVDLPHAGHNDILAVAHLELQSAHRRFLDRLASRPWASTSIEQPAVSDSPATP